MDAIGAIMSVMTYPNGDLCGVIDGLTFSQSDMRIFLLCSIKCKEKKRCGIKCRERRLCGIEIRQTEAKLESSKLTLNEHKASAGGDKHLAMV